MASVPAQWRAGSDVPSCDLEVTRKTATAIKMSCLQQVKNLNNKTDMI